MGLTQNFGFKTLGPGESIEDNNYQFGLADRELLDSLLQATLDHHHDGSTSADLDKPLAPIVTLGTGDGILEPGYTYEYKVAWVDEFGRESQASDPTTFTLPEDLATPNKPTLEFVPVGGTLDSGTYAYVVSAYRTDTYTETKASLASAITLPRGNTHAVALTIPDIYNVDDDYDGFNIYRRRPGGLDFFFIGSVTGSFNFTDTGLADDCNRFPPYASTIGTDRVVNIEVETVPDGYTWKIYRSSAPGLWDNSYLHHAVERTSETPGAPVATTYIDVGEGTAAGSPNDYGSFTFYNPSKIDLATEVQGLLPAEMIQGGGGGGGRPMCKVFIAAADAQQWEKDVADVQCDGTADDVEINAALTGLGLGEKIVLSSGTFECDASLVVGTNANHGVMEGIHDGSNARTTLMVNAITAVLSSGGNVFLSVSAAIFAFRNINIYSGTHDHIATDVMVVSTGNTTIKNCAIETYSGVGNVLIGSFQIIDSSILGNNTLLGENYPGTIRNSKLKASTGFAFHYKSTAWTVDNSTLQGDSSSGYALYGTDVGGSGAVLTVRDSTIIGRVHMTGLTSPEWGHAQFIGNRFTSSTHTITFVNMMKAIMVANRFALNTSTVITFTTCSYTIFTGNIFNNGGTYPGIVVSSGSNYNRFVGNQMALRSVTDSGYATHWDDRYVPADSTRWPTPAPTTIQAALDHIASIVDLTP